jgi:hypothetical protein
MAGLSFYLMGGKPPISWMGSKVGYAEPLAAILGLSRSNVSGFVWGDVGPNIAALAHLCGATGVTAEDVAGWLTLATSSYRAGIPDSGPNMGKIINPDRPESSWLTAENIATQIAANATIPATKAVADLIRSWKDEEPRALWDRLKAKGWPSLLLPEGCAGRWLGPTSVEDVAGWVHANAVSMIKDGSASSYSHVNGEGYHFTRASDGTQGFWTATTPELNAERVESLPTFPPIACWQGRAEDLALPVDLYGFVAYLDPPYKGDEATGGRKITGYKHGDCPRESVIAMARDYDKRGAIVAISESVRLDRELGEGWCAVQIDHARRGQKRTFSVQSEEWVTMNRPPQYIPPKQYALWGASGR